jgi:predicted ATPase
MISQLTVENYRCFKQSVDIPLGPMTFLFGPNGAGKTAILDALNQLSTTISGINRTFDSTFQPFGPYSLRNQAHDAAAPIKFGLVFEDRTPLGVDRLAYELVLTHEVDGIEGHESLFLNGHRLHASQGRMSAMARLDLPDPDEHRVVAAFIAWVRYMRRYRLSPSLIRDKVPFGDQRWVEPTGKQLPAALDYMMQNDPEAWACFTSIVSDMFPAIRELSVELFANECGISFCNASGRSLVGAHLSDGQAVALAIAFMLSSPFAPRVLCVEELENGLSPVAIRKVLGHIQACVESKRVVSQVVATTHSPYVISWADENAKALQVLSDGKVRSVAAALEQHGTTQKQSLSPGEACGVLETYWYS